MGQVAKPFQLDSFQNLRSRKVKGVKVILPQESLAMTTQGDAGWHQESLQGRVCSYAAPFLFVDACCTYIKEARGLG